jgi:hypothetical protein
LVAVTIHWRFLGGFDGMHLDNAIHVVKIAKLRTIYRDFYTYDFCDFKHLIAINQRFFPKLRISHWYFEKSLLIACIINIKDNDKSLKPW